MSKRKIVPLALLSIAGLGTGLAVGMGSIRWARKSRDIVKRLQCASPVVAGIVSFADFDNLPFPVSRYLRRVLTDGQPIVRAARITQSGALRESTEPGRKWLAFKAVEYFAPLAPGFQWDARIVTWPFIKVRDAYFDRRGSNTASALNLVTVVAARDSSEVTEATLVRYLAEAVWFPTALVPSPGLSWTAITHDRALATLVDGDISVSLEFQFNEVGEVSSVYTPGRYRAAHGKYVLTPWGGHYGAYAQIGRMRVPTVGVVQWHMKEGPVCVWKGKLSKVEYRFNPLLASGEGLGMRAEEKG